MMRLWAWFAVSGAALVVGAAACDYPEFHFEKKKTSPPPQGGTGGHAGQPGGSGGVGASGGSGGAVTTGGSGGAACVVGDIGVCGTGYKCSVVDVGNGQTGCVVAGPLAAWTRCAEDTDCAEGTWCDLTDWALVCKPVCQNLADCTPQPGAKCLQAKTPDLVGIPGLEVCTSHCHPKSASPCNQDNGPTTCVYKTSIGGWDCIESANIAEGQPCQDSRNCAKGLVCADNSCEKWCNPVGYNDGDCILDLLWCSPLSPEVSYDGAEYGAC